MGGKEPVIVVQAEGFMSDPELSPSDTVVDVVKATEEGEKGEDNTVAIAVKSKAVEEEEEEEGEKAVGNCVADLPAMPANGGEGGYVGRFWIHAAIS